MFESSSVQNIVVILIQALTVVLSARLAALKRQRRVFVCPTSAPRPVFSSRSL